MSAGSEPEVVLGSLRDELVRVAVRRHRRRAAWPRVAAGMAVATLLLTGGLVGVSSPPPAQADVRVEVSGERIVVTLVDLEHDSHEIEAHLRAIGLAVSVTAVPVGPSQVGRFVGDAESGALPSDLRAVGARQGTFAGFSLPIGWSGGLDLRVGRPARGNEPYATFADALAPGEPLACWPVVGHPAAEVAERLARTRLDAVFQVVSDQATAAIPLAAIAHSDYRAWPVVAADATSRGRVVLRIRAGQPARDTTPPC